MLSLQAPGGLPETEHLHTDDGKVSEEHSALCSRSEWETFQARADKSNSFLMCLESPCTIESS